MAHGRDEVPDRSEGGDDRRTTVVYVGEDFDSVRFSYVRVHGAEQLRKAVLATDQLVCESPG